MTHLKRGEKKDPRGGKRVGSNELFLFLFLKSWTPTEVKKEGRRGEKEKGQGDYNLCCSTLLCATLINEHKVR